MALQGECAESVRLGATRQRLASADVEELARYADRFRAETYADDGMVGLYVELDDDAAVWMPERLFARFVHVAEAYELHTFPLLGGPEPTRLNRQQIQALHDEVAFVTEVLPGDRLVGQEGGRISRYLGSLLSGPEVMLTVEGE